MSAEYLRRDYGRATCPACGSAFTRRAPAQWICSRACAWLRARSIAAQAPRVSAACTLCGAAFSRRRVGHRFCSSACRDRAFKQAGGYGRATCPACGATFARSGPRVRHCSPRCGNLGQRAPTRERVLAILEQGRPVSSAEIAGRIYGAADWPELHALRNAVLRLRQNGHRIVSERNGAVQPRYRLVREGGAA